VADGAPGQVVADYLESCRPGLVEVQHEDIRRAPGNHVFRLRRLRVYPVGGSSSDSITIRTPFVVEIEYWKLVSDRSVDVWIEIHDERGVHLFDTGWTDRPPGAPGLRRGSFVVPGDLMNNGRHRAAVVACPDSAADAFRCDDQLVFEIQDTMDGQREGYMDGEWHGAIRPYLKWTMTPIDDPSGQVAAETQVPAWGRSR
jgi:lipopolysaccharide transport system ATP-binding protein